MVITLLGFFPRILLNLSFKDFPTLYDWPILPLISKQKIKLELSSKFCSCVKTGYKHVSIISYLGKFFFSIFNLFKLKQNSHFQSYLSGSEVGFKFEYLFKYA